MKSLIIYLIGKLLRLLSAEISQIKKKLKQQEILSDKKILDAIKKVKQAQKGIW